MIKNFPQSNSQAHQESFVLNVLNEKRNGFYLELGAGWAIKNSNTYILESEYDWSGLSFEIDKRRAEKYNEIRLNKTICDDAITFDYLNYFKQNDVPTQIDYLQMDLHPAEDTLKALKALPLDQYRFSVITYEHNGYLNKINKHESQKILKDLGYELVAEDLTYLTIAYEDWWIDPKVIEYNNYKDFISVGINHNKLFGEPWKY
jgi:hypothetical protein